MTNKRAGFRWDCGINRPSCIDPNVKALTAPYDGPQAVGIDKSTSSTTINNNP